MIIVCTSCKTKFSVDDAHVERFENPRFHCSRCNHYFHLNETSEHSSQSNKVKESLRPQRPINTKHTNTGHVNTNQINTVRIENNIVQEPKQEPENEKAAVKATWPDIKGREELEVDYSDFKIEKTNYFQGKTSKVISHDPFDFGDNLGRAKEIHTQAKNGHSSFKTFAFFAPLVILGGVFFMWGKAIAAAGPTAAVNPLNLLNGSASHIAPEGVEVEDLTPEIIALENGKQVLLIKGNVSNATASSFSDINLEAVIYDNENNPLKKLIVNTNNKLQHAAEINSLNEKIINVLQEKSAGSDTPLILEANSKNTFKVAVTELDKLPSWFSVRVYSVKSL